MRDPLTYTKSTAAFSVSLRTKAERLKRWDLLFCTFCSLVLVFIIFTIRSSGFTYRSSGFTYRSSDSFFFFFLTDLPNLKNKLLLIHTLFLLSI
uniref:Uncharacterized protein n=1 Tax=Musa acuminata subsp. malaccensis TaxID=214687 RepID=A0A804HMV4_MUSAM